MSNMLLMMPSYVETDDQLRSIEEIKRDIRILIPWIDFWLGMLVLGKAEGLQCVQHLRLSMILKQVIISSSDDGLAQQHYTNF